MRALQRRHEQPREPLAGEALGDRVGLQLALGRERRVAVAVDEGERLALDGRRGRAVADEDDLGGARRELEGALVVALRHGGGVWQDDVVDLSRHRCEHVFVSTKATILHADLDAFYASVEQRDNPTLRGRPVIVGMGVVLACSYEAKARGVKTAMGGHRACGCAPTRSSCGRG